jgi:DNA ligase (NAD+)
MAEKSAANIIKGVESSKKIPFEKVLFALGIRYVGETVAKKLARHYKNIDNLINASFDELVNVDEIGERIAQSILDFFSNEINIDIINRLKESGVTFSLDEKTLEEQTDKLQGLVFVVSGVFSLFSRTELKKSIEDNGGKVTGSISKKTSFIIAGDNMGPSKKEKADKLNIPIISENDFIEMLT